MASRTGQIFDLNVFETNNGGDILLLGNDLAIVYGHQNQVYLALFGGNVQMNTPSVLTAEENFDYWANKALWSDNQNFQFNSNTERTLDNTPLTSAGRILIENAVKQDLKFLSEIATVTVSATITSVNTISIEIRTEYFSGPKILTIINYTPSGKGDFSLIDFNSDFY